MMDLNWLTPVGVLLLGLAALWAAYSIAGTADQVATQATTTLQDVSQTMGETGLSFNRIPQAFDVQMWSMVGVGVFLVVFLWIYFRMEKRENARTYTILVGIQTAIGQLLAAKRKPRGRPVETQVTGKGENQ